MKYNFEKRNPLIRKVVLKNDTTSNELFDVVARQGTWNWNFPIPRGTEVEIRERAKNDKYGDVWVSENHLAPEKAVAMNKNKINKIVEKIQATKANFGGILAGTNL